MISDDFDPRFALCIRYLRIHICMRRLSEFVIHLPGNLLLEVVIFWIRMRSGVMLIRFTHHCLSNEFFHLT